MTFVSPFYDTVHTRDIRDKIKRSSRSISVMIPYDIPEPNFVLLLNKGIEK